jgi:hypothetical protein
MEDDVAIDQWSHRPHISNSLVLLKEMALTLHAATVEVTETRDHHDVEAVQLITEGKIFVSELESDLARIQEKQEAHDKISVLQTQITTDTRDTLSPSLKHLSEFYRTEATIRFPFAERLADFSEELQKVFRAKQDTQCRLHEYLPAKQLEETLKQFDDIAAKIQEKIKSEVDAATAILTPNSKRIFDLNTTITATQEGISSMQQNLTASIALGADYLAQEHEVKQIIYQDQLSFLRGLEIARTIQNELVTHFKQVEEEQQQLVHHIFSLLTGLLVKQEAMPSALRPPLAIQPTADNQQDCLDLKGGK